MQCSKEFTLTINDDPVCLITTASPLPNGTAFTAYSEQLNATNGVAPFTWEVIAGAIPQGGTLSTGGLVEISPTDEATGSFTVRATDSTPGTPLTCTKEFQLTIDPTPPPNFSQMSWTDTEFESNGGNATFTPHNTTGNPGVGHCTTVDPPPPGDSSEAQVDAAGSLSTVVPWTGNCNLNLAVGATPTVWCEVQVLLSIDGVPVYNYQWNPAYVGSADFPFDATGHTLIEIVVICAAVNSFVDPGTRVAGVTVTFTNL